MRYPFAAPRPPRIADHLDAFARIDESRIYSNNGPELRRFEAAVTEHLFGGHGASLGVGNATLGLMLAIKQAAVARPDAKYAIVPALTFAATGQAAHWAGLTPLICDIDPESWDLCPKAERRLLEQYGRDVAVVVPYATFGDAVDVARYELIARKYGVAVVVDAASSLGYRDRDGLGLAATASFATVHSMHATKTFAVAEGCLIHSGDEKLIATLRAMTNFGFEGKRSATLAGFNAKLPEITAVLANAKLDEIDAVIAKRDAVERAYRDALSGFDLQKVRPGLRASQFMPVLLPRALARQRDEIMARLAGEGVGTGCYFSPHLGEQPWFEAHALIAPTPIADDVSRRIMSLPITDLMTAEDAVNVAESFVSVCAKITQVPARPRSAAINTLIVGGGPGGTALLTAASKRGQLADLSRAGLAIVERDTAVGNGRLGRYAITSDSTATTFLTAVKDNPHPELAAIEQAPAGRVVAAYADSLGVPLVEVGPLLRATGERLAGIVSEHGGEVLTGHEALDSRRTAEGHWKTRLKRLSDGQIVERVSENIVIATGGHQPLERLAAQRIAGENLNELAGDRLVQSDEVLTLGGYDRVAERLSGKRSPKIVVIGGSTSALTTVALLLKGAPAIPLGAGGITLLHRRPLRPFYHSVEAARAEGYEDFGADDICPVSGFVYRLAGFRLEARELVLRMLGVDGRAPDPRVALHRIEGAGDKIARHIVADADLVIAALGYRPFAHKLLDRDGSEIDLAVHSGDAMVDPHCRIRGIDGTPVPGAFGIGLAAGFVPWGKLGGEKSFRGQANGLWLWQNDIGGMILDQIAGTNEARAVA